MIETEPGPTPSGSQTPEEFMENLFVKEAVIGSEIETYYGDTPPSLVGQYTTTGEITKHHSGLIGPFPAIVSFTACLFNQGHSDSISFAESVGDFLFGGEESLITGDNGRFTIWGEFLETNNVIGLSDSCTATVVFIMSGRKLDNGDIRAQGLTVTTELQDCQGFVGGWYMWEADFSFDGTCSETE